MSSRNPRCTIDTPLDEQVTDYLKKKGFTRTEAIFRQETSNLGPDGRPARGSEDNGPKKYLRGFTLLRDWIDNNLDIYKVCSVAFRNCRC
jgi:transcription initiation factor TFIID subunit 5